MFCLLSKSEDSICQKRLLHRLKEIGLIGKILDIIKSIYKSPKVSLIHQGKITQTFFTTINLKQMIYLIQFYLTFT